MDKVIIIDASQILTIMRRSGVTGLSVLLRRGEYFFFSDDLKQELIDGGEWDSKNGKLFQKWRQEQRVNGRLLEVDTRVSIEEYETYDFGKRGTSRGGKELSDMSIRKFMLQNKHRFTFELISRDLELLDHRVDNPKHPLYGLQFDRLSTRSALTWLATHPDVPLNPERLRSLLKAIQDGKFDLSKKRGIATHELEREKYHLPETYADALRERMRRAATEPRRRSDIRGLSSQANARLGVAPVDQGSAVPLSPSGAPLEGQLDGLTGSQSGGEIGGRIDPEAGLSGKASGSLQEGPSIGRRFMNMLRKGAPVVLLGLAIPPVFSAVRARAEERNIPFDQAARELGLEFGEEELKDLAAEAGVDLAITFTPIGPLKKAWDVLGNIDDIVSLMQLYGDAYPDNETIQQMAALADEVADSAALAAYVDGRDALTGAVGAAIDFVFGSASSEEETAEAIGKLRGAIREGSAELDEAVVHGATAEELSDLLIRQAEESAPAPLVAPDFRNPDLSPERVLEGEAPLSDVEQLPGSDPILPSALLPETGAGAVDEVRAPVERSVEPGEDRFARKTSYDTYRKLGRTPEEEKEALAHFEDLRRESYLDTGNLYMAEEIAVALFKLKWDRSAFAADDGTVMKYPVEKAYTDPEGDGHGYVRADVETLLKREGIQARRWYLEPNGKTASDRARGIMDRDGYGPRMTLSYDDEAGQRHVLTDAFQAHVNVARQRRRAELEREDRERAKQYGIDWPETRDMKPFEVARTRLLHAATLPELRQQPTDKKAVDAKPVPAERNETPPPEPSATQSLAGSGPKKQGGESRPFLFSKGI